MAFFNFPGPGCDRMQQIRDKTNGDWGDSPGEIAANWLCHVEIQEVSP